MNVSNYSPYNKSYRFILFQNQAYHEKNKRIASPCVKTNIRYSHQLHGSSNPQKAFSERKTHSSHGFRDQIGERGRGSMSFSESAMMMGKGFSMSQSHSRSQSMNNSMMVRSSSSMSQNGNRHILLNDEKRVVHKNLSYEKFRNRKVSRENSQMVNRLLQASCQVTRKKQAEKSFQNHLKYKDVRRKFHNDGLRKSKMALGNTSLLCPTLSEYNKSGLGEKFVELDLSMSMSPSPPPSPTRSYRKKISDGPLIQPKLSESVNSGIVVDNDEGNDEGDELKGQKKMMGLE